jgi:hypothetical protein
LAFLVERNPLRALVSRLPTVVGRVMTGKRVATLNGIDSVRAYSQIRAAA